VDRNKSEGEEGSLCCVVSDETPPPLLLLFCWGSIVRKHPFNLLHVRAPFEGANGAWLRIFCTAPRNRNRIRAVLGSRASLRSGRWRVASLIPASWVGSMGLCRGLRWPSDGHCRCGACVLALAWWHYFSLLMCVSARGSSRQGVLLPS